eukprot:scaffold1136_cov399-Prasinococcus_capsulatus_cf.AAC.17
MVDGCRWRPRPALSWQCPERDPASAGREGPLDAASATTTCRAAPPPARARVVALPTADGGSRWPCQGALGPASRLPRCAVRPQLGGAGAGRSQPPERRRLVIACDVAPSRPTRYSYCRVCLHNARFELANQTPTACHLRCGWKPSNMSALRRGLGQQVLQAAWRHSTRSGAGPVHTFDSVCRASTVGCWERFFSSQAAQEQQFASRSAELIAKEQRYTANNYKPVPVVFSRALGAVVWDADGKTYLDFLSGYSAINQGHSHPKIIKAITEQAQLCALTARAFHNDRLPDYAELLTKLLGYGTTRRRFRL